MNTIEAPPAGGSASSKGSILRRYRWAIVGLVIAIGLVVFLAPAASSDPDGLDRVSQDKSFAEKAEDPGYEILPDYSIPGVDNEYWSTVLSGVIGVGIVFSLAIVLGVGLRVMRKGRPSEDRSVPGAG